MQPIVDAVAIPCKVGDKVWCIYDRKHGARVVEGTATEIYFTENMRMGIVVRRIARGEWGKKIFATREAAEAALAKMGG